MLRTLGRIFIAIGERLSPEPSAPLSPTEQWLRKVKADYKKQRLIDPSTGRLNIRFNPLSDEEHWCGPIRSGDPSEELAFLEWMAEKGIELPKKDILRNDDQWRTFQNNRRYNPLEQDEDHFIPHVA